MAIAGCVFVSSAATQGQGTAPRPQPIDGGNYEASGVAAVSGTSAVLFVADGRPGEVFWLNFDPSGAQAGRAVPVALGLEVPDPEDIATDGRHFYVVGSQSQGNGRRAGLVRFRFDSRTRRVEHVEAIVNLGGMLTGLVPELGGRGRRGVQSLNIEGLAWDPARRRLLVGLRAPVIGGAALIIPLVFKDAAAPFTAANLELDTGGPIRLMLGGLAIRGLGYDEVTRRVLIIAGASTYADAETFRLMSWDGIGGTPARELAVFPARQKPEGVTVATPGGKPRLLLVFDTGGFQWGQILN